jgi:hypothetical protein
MMLLFMSVVSILFFLQPLFSNPPPQQSLRLLPSVYQSLPLSLLLYAALFVPLSQTSYQVRPTSRWPWPAVCLSSTSLPKLNQQADGRGLQWALTPCPTENTNTERRWKEKEREKRKKRDRERTEEEIVIYLLRPFFFAYLHIFSSFLSIFSFLHFFLLPTPIFMHIFSYFLIFSILHLFKPY